MGAPVLGWAMVMVKIRAKMVVAMIMAMPTGRATRTRPDLPKGMIASISEDLMFMI